MFRQTMAWVSASLAAAFLESFAQVPGAYGMDPVRLAESVRVNALESRLQRNSSLCIQPGKVAAIVWEDGVPEEPGFDGSSSGIFAQRVLENGTLTGPEFAINNFTIGTQRDPEVACADSGDFAVTWGSGYGGAGPDGSGEAIVARRFNADGTPKGDEFVVNASTSGDQSDPDICAGSDGAFVVVWGDEGGSIYGRKYDGTGTAVVPEFRVDTSDFDAASYPVVGCAADGSFVVAWASTQNSGDVLARRYGNDGIASSLPFVVHEHTEGEQGVPSDAWFADDRNPLDIAVARDGRFVVVWEETSSFYYDHVIVQRRFAPDATPQGVSSAVNQDHVIEDWYRSRWSVAAAIDDAGNVAVIYTEYYMTLDDPRWRMRLFDADGDPTGPPFTAAASDSIVITAGEVVVATASTDDVYVNRYGGNMCATVPSSGCRLAGAANAKLKGLHTTEFFKDRLQWAWKKGAATPMNALGDPVGGTSRYQVCLYDASASAQPIFSSLAPPAHGLFALRSWTGGKTGFKLSWPAQTGDVRTGGIMKLAVKAGADGRASVQVKAAGSYEQAVALPFAMPVTIQLIVDSGNGFECWQTTFVSASKNDEFKFDAKGP